MHCTQQTLQGWKLTTRPQLSEEQPILQKWYKKIKSKTSTRRTNLSLCQSLSFEFYHAIGRRGRPWYGVSHHADKRCRCFPSHRRQTKAAQQQQHEKLDCQSAWTRADLPRPAERTQRSFEWRLYAALIHGNWRMFNYCGTAHAGVLTIHRRCSGKLTHKRCGFHTEENLKLAIAASPTVERRAVIYTPGLENCRERMDSCRITCCTGVQYSSSCSLRQ